MSNPRSPTCLFCTFTRAVRSYRLPSHRNLHASPAQFNRKPKHPNIKASEMEPIDLTRGNDLTEATREQMRKSYSPQQMAAIEAASTIIDPKRFSPNTVRTDPWSLKYYDDLTNVDPMLDKPIREPWSNTDGSLRLKHPDELDDDLANFMANFPLDPKEQETAWENFEKNLRMTVGREEAERRPRSAKAAPIPPIEDGSKKSKKARSPNEQQEEEPSPALLRLMQMTGYTARQIAGLRVKTIITHRVVNQTRLGKIGKIYHLSVAGNGQGLIGIGEGKAEDAGDARLQSQYRAIRNMQPILRYEGRTIYGDVKGKVSATELELYARPPGKISFEPATLTKTQLNTLRPDQLT